MNFVCLCTWAGGEQKLGQGTEGQRLGLGRAVDRETKGGQGGSRWHDEQGTNGKQCGGHAREGWRVAADGARAPAVVERRCCTTYCCCILWGSPGVTFHYYFFSSLPQYLFVPTYIYFSATDGLSVLANSSVCIFTLFCVLGVGVVSSHLISSPCQVCVSFWGFEF